MKRIITIILSGVLCTGPGFAQNESDALRFSQKFFGSTARAGAMGGAFASLGGDFSSLGYNPAGIAVYRTTEFTFTPAFGYDDISSRYMGTRRSDTKYDFGMYNLGFVASFNNDNQTGWVGTNFGFGYNRYNNFNRNKVVEGVNFESSIADYFIAGPYGANGVYPDDLDPFWERLAFDTYVIDTVPGFPTWYETPVMLGQTQREVISTSGNTGEWLFSFGANYEHKLYLGATFGIESVNYTRNSNYSEFDELNLSDFDQLLFKKNLKTTGRGYSFKLGAIYRPVEFVRIGGSVHLPTFFTLTDEYQHQMESWFNSGDYYNAEPTNIQGNRIGPRLKEYSLTTPFRAIGGVAFMLPLQLGVVSVDYEYVDYTTMRLREIDGGYDFYHENQVIQDVYRPAGNIRAGAELRLGMFMVRGGFASYGSPYASGQLNEGAGYTVYSGGIGFRERTFYIDMGYTYTANEYYYMPYECAIIDPSFNQSSNSRFLLTTGIRF